VPPLTTIRLPAYEQGLRAAEMLINTIEGAGPAEKGLLLDTELVIRESCGSNRH